MPDAAIFLLPDLGSSFPGAIFDFLASYSSTSFAGKFPTAGSWKHKLCSKERLSQLRLFNSLPVILPVFTKRRTGQSVPEKDVRSQIQKCRWENHQMIFLLHRTGWSVSTGRKGWGWAGIGNSDLITTILLLVITITIVTQYHHFCQTSSLLSLITISVNIVHRPISLFPTPSHVRRWHDELCQVSLFPRIKQRPFKICG